MSHYGLKTRNKLIHYIFKLIETSCFDELNVLTSSDEPQIEDYPDEEEIETGRSLGCFSLMKKSSTTYSNTNSESSSRAKPIKSKSAEVDSNDDHSTTMTTTLNAQNNKNKINNLR